MSLPNAAAACRAPALRAKLDAGAHIEERDVKGRTALFRAARVGRLENIVLLLERGADPNAKDNTDEAPLQAAARYGYLECVRALIEAGARINDFPDPAKTEYSETALCSAVRRKFSEVAEFLLGAGADPNAASSSERLPLHEAAGSGNLPLCRALVAAGANLKTTVKLPLYDNGHNLRWLPRSCHKTVTAMTRAMLKKQGRWRRAGFRCVMRPPCWRQPND